MIYESVSHSRGLHQENIASRKCLENALSNPPLSSIDSVTLSNLVFANPRIPYNGLLLFFCHRHVCRAKASPGDLQNTKRTNNDTKGLQNVWDVFLSVPLSQWHFQSKNHQRSSLSQWQSAVVSLVTSQSQTRCYGTYLHWSRPLVLRHEHCHHFLQILSVTQLSHALSSVFGMILPQENVMWQNYTCISHKHFTELSFPARNCDGQQGHETLASWNYTLLGWTPEMFFDIKISQGYTQKKSQQLHKTYWGI